jgi:hypothetical protein
MDNCGPTLKKEWLYLYIRMGTGQSFKNLSAAPRYYSLVPTGSFNFTKAAEHNNAQNLLVVEDASLAKQYAGNWQKHLKHSEAYGARPQ